MLVAKVVHVELPLTAVAKLLKKLLAVSLLQWSKIADAMLLQLVADLAGVALACWAS